MPELVEVKIMSDFINYHSKDKIFNKAFHVEKGNNPIIFKDSEFKLSSISNGKELIININYTPIYVFMGMNGNWKYVPTVEWDKIKHVRLRMDDSTGHSLLLHGGFMGPKYLVNKRFNGVKRGPDPTKEFDKFKENILQNINKINKPIGESLLNQTYFNGIGAYLAAEIIGRLDIDPFRPLNSLNQTELNNLFNMILECCYESYRLGGGQLKDWYNPFGENDIKSWLKYYGNKETCLKHKFGTRNIWIQKKFIHHPNHPKSK